MGALLKFLRTIQRAPAPARRPPQTFQTTDGRTVQGQVLGTGRRRSAVAHRDGRVHLLSPRRESAVREVTSETSWPTYNGDPGGNRYTTLTQINKATVGRLAPSWIFTVPTSNRAASHAGGRGRHHVRHRAERVLRARRRQRAADLAVPAAAHAGPACRRGHESRRERGRRPALHAHRPRAHHRAQPLHGRAAVGRRARGLAQELLRDVGAARRRAPRSFPASPAASTARTGSSPRTIRKPARSCGGSGPCRSRGAPGSETWQGKDIDHGGAPTWFTGSYDPVLDLVYWPVGNPSKEYNGDDRKGDNLYAGSILALDRRTGALKWHYQFTPHDLWDWDATQTSVLIDANWQGQPRKLMLHASRNGFFYVFDRTDGKLLLWKPFVRNLTWASGIDASGRPIKLPNQEPTPRRDQGLPLAGRGDQLVLAVVQPADRALLRADLREVQHLHEERRRRVGAGQVVSRRLAARRARSAAAAHPQGDRHHDRRDSLGAAAGGAGQFVGRHAGDRQRPRDLRRRERRR